MKLSCNVAKDLLPLYHDGVCSDESRALVEAHLESCESCRALLQELNGELELPHGEPDDLGTMKKLENQVRKGKKRAWLKGAAAVLAVVLLVTAVIAGMQHHESNRHLAAVLKFTEGHEDAAIADEGYPYDYDWVHGNYLFRVNLPGEDGTGGTVEVREYKWTKDLSNPNDLIQVSLNVQITENGAYQYLITVEDWAQNAGTPQMVILDQNGQTVHDEGWDEEIIARKDKLIMTYRAEIINIITAAEREWPFLIGEG